MGSDSLRDNASRFGIDGEIAAFEHLGYVFGVQHCWQTGIFGSSSDCGAHGVSPSCDVDGGLRCPP